MTPFVVTGLPRSRTAWLSVFLTHGMVRCWHEGARVNESIHCLLERLSLDSRYISGDSNSALCLKHGELIHAASKGLCNLVVIRRDPKECAESLERSLEGIDISAQKIIDATMPGYARLADFSGALRVNFESLDDPASLRAIMQKIAPSETFPEKWWTQLHELRITQMPVRALERQGGLKWPSD